MVIRWDSGWVLGEKHEGIKKCKLIITSKETKNTNSKEHKHPYVHCSVIYCHQDMEAAQESIRR